MSYSNTKHYMKRFLLILAIACIAPVFLGATEQPKGHFQVNLKGNAIPGIYWDTHFAADLSLGWRFNEKRFLGLGTGCHWIRDNVSADPDCTNGFVPAIPLFADYIRYYPFAKHPRNSFFLEMEAGGAYYVDNLPLKSETKRVFPYLNGKLGFDFSIYRNLGVNVGLNLIWGCYNGITIGDGGGHGVALTAGFRF